MSLATAELPADPAALGAFALACQCELKAAQTAAQLKALEIEKLRFQIAKLCRMQFGRSSERITRQIGQLELQLDELETNEAEDFARTEQSGSEIKLTHYQPARKLWSLEPGQRLVKRLPDHNRSISRQLHDGGASTCVAIGHATTAPHPTPWCIPCSSVKTKKPPTLRPARTSVTGLVHHPAVPSDNGAQRHLAAGSPHCRGVSRLQTVEAAQAADGTAEKEFDISNP